jgi:protein-L-isoaspartate(D-aspartate) O-methyltransferase
MFQKKTTSLDEAQNIMIEKHLKARGIKNERVLTVMEQLPRHLFVEEDMQNSAYSDNPLPIGYEQTISQPYIVAHMTELLNLPADGQVTVLEIGTGSGYQTAILSRLVEQVYTVERIAELADSARYIFQQLEIKNIEQKVGDGSCGWPEYAPFDRIITTAASPDVPPPLIDQLADGGILIAPVGYRGYQQLICLQRYGDVIERQELTSVAFVPLLGEYGWSEASEMYV